MSAGAGKNYDEIKVGEELPQLKLKMDEETYFRYNKLVGEINPLHFDKDFAQRLGFEDIVVAGVYTFSFIPKMVEEYIGDNGRVSNIDIKYHKPVYINETIVQKAAVIKKEEGDAGKSARIEVKVSDSKGKVLTEAVLSVMFT